MNQAPNDLATAALKPLFWWGIAWTGFRKCSVSVGGLGVGWLIRGGLYEADQVIVREEIRALLEIEAQNA